MTEDQTLTVSESDIVNVGDNEELNDSLSE